MENNGLKKKYGLLTAISMVIGIVIGSGVFFKAETILKKTGGNMPLGIWAWIIGGLIMLCCCLAFATMAKKFEKVNGLVDYAELYCGKRYAYFLAWFIATIYYPGMTSVLAWVAARYTCQLLGWSIVGGECMALGALFLIASYGLNALAPRAAGKFQVSTTIIKLIPLVLMAVVGIVYGVVKGITVENFTNSAAVEATGAVHTNPLFAAVVATAFAYEGWIIATSINSELKNSKRNLPIALVTGSITIILIYTLYYVGLAGGATNTELVKDPTVSFTNIFGNAVGNILLVFIVISCLGTLNGLMLASVRGCYSFAVRGQGFRPDVFGQVDAKTNVPHNSAIAGLVLCAVWYVYFFGANLVEKPWFGLFSFDSSELPIITIYAFYIPVFIMFMVRAKDENAFKRFVLPLLALAGSVFMIAAAIYAHGIEIYLNAKAAGNGFSMPVLFYLIVFAVVMALGLIPLCIKKKKE